HIGFHYSLDQLEKLVTKMNNQQPDIIVFTGDLVDNPDIYPWNKRLIKTLQSLKANFGKFWIYGNHDHGGYGTNILKQAMDESGFQLWKNEHKVIDKEKDRIIIAGVDDIILGKPDKETALENVNRDLFSILLPQEPHVSDTALQCPFDVQLSWHSHGVPVRFPFIGH